MTFQKSSRNVKTKVEAMFLKRFCSGWEGNINISKLLFEAEIHVAPNTWENWISIQYRKSMGKHKHFKFMGLLNILDEAEIHTIPKTWEK